MKFTGVPQIEADPKRIEIEKIELFQFLREFDLETAKVEEFISQLTNAFEKNPKILLDLGEFLPELHFCFFHCFGFHQFLST